MKSLETLCEGRVTPLLCGCVKSNLGHTEATSGLCSIAKVIVAGETGVIPPNLHYSEPQKGIEALRNTKIKVITENTPWNGGYVAINNFGIGGSNAHLLLKSYDERRIDAPKDDVPRLVTVSGRTKEAVEHMLTFLQSTNTNIELVALMHQIFRIPIPNHEFRGYAIVNETNSSGTKQIQRIGNTNRPIWFVYPGMGSQWSSMAKELMRLHCFKNSIVECHSILENCEFNLIDVVTNDNPAILENIVNCFVGITALMIALTDVLTSCGIKPDGMVGHSFGEIVCAYVDGCLDKKAVLLAAYYRGIASSKTTTIKGLMAVIGLGGEELQIWCPPSVEIVCRNSNRNCTVAGPEEEVKNLIILLESKNIFAREIFSSNIAYHSSYIRDTGFIYEQYMKEVISNPKERSSKWISSCVADVENTTSNLGKFCSASYFAYNLTNPVLFENCLKRVPKNAIVIEIAPHSILKSVLNDALGTDTINVSLMNKHSSRILPHFLASLGTLYNNNVNLDLSLVYPSVSFPVSAGTPMISPLVKWNHSKDWYVPFEKSNLLSTIKNENRVVINYEHENQRYLKDYIIDGENVYPPSGYLTMVLEALAKRRNIDYQTTSVVFSDVQFHKIVKSNGLLEFEVTITRQNGAFEIARDDEVVAQGFVNIIERDSEEDMDPIVNEENLSTISIAEIYKELKIKGYLFGNAFRTILRCNVEANKGVIMHSQNWVIFLDSLFQFYYLRTLDYHRLSLISRINVLEINLEKQTKTKNPGRDIPVEVVNSYLACGGVKISGVEMKSKRRQSTKKPTIQTFKFAPFFNEQTQSIENLVNIITTIVLENNVTSRVNVLEFVPRNSYILSLKIDEYFKKLPYYKLDSTLVFRNDTKPEVMIPGHFKVHKKVNNSNKNTHLVIVNDEDVTTEVDTLENISNSLTESGFVIVRGTKDRRTICEIPKMKASGQFYTQNERIILWHKVMKVMETSVDHVSINPADFRWIRTLQTLIRQNNTKRIILHSNSEISGIIGLYNCLRKEACGNNLRCFLTIDSKCPPFSLQDEFYEKQIELDLAMNVYKDGYWGCYVPFMLDSAPEISVPFARLAFAADDDDSLSWICQTDDDFCKIDQSANEIIRLYYVTVPHDYFQSVSTYSKDIHTRNYISVYEFCGKNSEGRNFMGISLNKTITNVLKRTDCLCWQIPEEWPLQDAVTLPLAFVTAVSILECGRLQRSRSVLVQNAYSHNGHALMSLALYHKYTVFTVENNRQESIWVQTHFPNVRKSFCPGECNITDELHELTCGEGIDIIAVTSIRNYTDYLLPSLSDNGSLFYTRPEDRLMSKISQNVIRENRQFYRINAEKIIRTTKIIRTLKTQIDEIIASGTIEPFPQLARIVKTPEELKCTKDQKIILQIIPKEESDDYSQKAIKKFTCSPHDCFIICGGLGGMGLELAGWLIDRGASKIVLVSRTGHCDGYKHRKLDQFRSHHGVTVVISTDDISTSKGVMDLLKRATKLGQIIGIFNTTLILKDNSFENQTEDSFRLVSGAKAVATYLLDKLSRKLCPYLKYFVVFSSITCGYGNAGQSNYGYANSMMERICESRKRQGFPALAIEWARVDDVGYMENVDKVTVPAGTELQPIRSCLEILDRLLCQDDPIVASFVVSEPDSKKESTNGESIFKTVKKILDKSEIQLTAESTLKDVGLDSIAIAEVKNLLEQECNTFMNVKEIYDLRLEELWKIEKMKKDYQYTVDEYPRKMATLEEVYRNFFKIIIKQETSLEQTFIARLPSFLHNGNTTEVPIADERTIFLLPSVEGVTEIMQPLAKNIDFQALCVQYNIRMSSVKEISHAILPQIEKRLLYSNEPFHILGYSYGGLVAMEICHELEKKGRTGHLYLVDSSPNIVKWISKALYKDREYLTNTIAFIRAIQPEIDIRKLEYELSQQNDWISTRDFIRELLPQDITPPKETLDTILDMLRRRNDDLESYESVPKKSLVSKVYFFRPEDSMFEIPADNGLLEYCNIPIQEFSIPGNHFTALTSEKLAYYVRNLHKNQTFI